MKNLRTSSILIKAGPVRVCLLLLALAALAAGLSICLGAVTIPPWELGDILLGNQSGSAAARIVLFVRLPRTCASLTAGAALAVSGTIIQSVLSNPLAAPNIIGVNAGAGLAVVLCCAAAPGLPLLTQAAAFAGAFLGVFLVLVMAEKTGASRITLVLAGVVVSSVFGAAIDAVITLIPDALNGYSDFRIGGLSGVTMAQLQPAMVVVLLGILAAVSFSSQLDVLMLGTETARSLGLSVGRVRLGMLVAAAALAGAAVSFCGLLGFVGLIVPHMMRRLVGEESRFLLISCTLGGAALLTLCDLAARTLFAPYELPVGIVMSFVGGPFFLWLLFRQRGGRAHG